MILKLQVVVIAEDGHQEICEITSVERGDLKPEALGLTLAEGKPILRRIQQIVMQRQASTCLAPCWQCPDCGNLRTGNGSAVHARVFGPGTNARNIASGCIRWYIAQ